MMLISLYDAISWDVSVTLSMLKTLCTVEEPVSNSGYALHVLFILF